MSVVGESVVGLLWGASVGAVHLGLAAAGARAAGRGRRWAQLWGFPLRVGLAAGLLFLAAYWHPAPGIAALVGFALTERIALMGARGVP